MKNVLLLGNGVNRAPSNSMFPSWSDLLQNVGDTFGIPIVGNDYIPFPITFEQMVQLKSGHIANSEKVRNLKRAISRILSDSRIIPNICHQSIVESKKYSDILTTNYDYNLEKVLDPDFCNKKRDYAVNLQEFMHSLKRCYEIKGKRIWHIHGELFSSRNFTNDSSNHYEEESILIGYDQYALYLRNIVDNVKSKRNKYVSTHNPEKWFYDNLKNRIQNGDMEHYPSPYWTDHFFMSNIDIVGFSFDFSEIHLWWLLNCRARLYSEGLISNTIRFFEPIIPSVRDTERAKGIRSILTCMGVAIERIYCNDYEEFYKKISEL